MLNKGIWLPATMIAVVVCAIVFLAIVGIGEFLLFLEGDIATAGALGILVGITVVAAIAAKRVS